MFDAARLAIDIDGGAIAATPRDAEPKGQKLDLETHRRIETVPVSIEGRDPVQAEFDLGNGSGMLIGVRYAAKTGLSTPDRLIGRKAGGGIGGEVMRDLVMLRSVEIAGETFPDIPAAIDATPNAGDANIGVEMLRHFSMTVDFAQHAVWLEAKQTEPQP